MSYYILPKIHAYIDKIKITTSQSINVKFPYISYTALKFHNEIKEQILQNTDISKEYTDIIKFINPYEFIFSKIPGSKLSVSKLKPGSNLFYEFLENAITTNLFDHFHETNMKTLHISIHAVDTIECLEMQRENTKDEHTQYPQMTDIVIHEIGATQYDFLFFQTNNETLQTYMYTLLEALMLIFKNQANNGNAMIQIDDLFHKLPIDVVYLLTSLYEKVYIIKPQVSNPATFEKYIVCKKFRRNEFTDAYFITNYNALYKSPLSEDPTLFDFEIPYFFKSKINDINIIFGQSQLESLNILMNIVNNKNPEERMTNMRKSFVQKSILWCEKYKIPCNRFCEKVNIFLPVLKEDFEPANDAIQEDLNDS